MENTFEKLLDFINLLEIIDTHEHLPSFEKDRDMNTDILKEYFAHYFNRDLLSSGLPLEDYNKVLESGMPVEEKYMLIEKYWENSRFTGYGRSLDIAVKEIYGIDRISYHFIKDLNERFSDSLKPGHWKKILKDKCRIKTSLLSVGTLEPEYDKKSAVDRSIYCDNNFFSPIYIINKIVWPKTWSDMEQIEKESGQRITSFEDYLDAAEALIEKSFNLGAIALKNILAYERTLFFEKVTRNEAEEEFNGVFATRHLAPDFGGRIIYTGKRFQDYMMHFILQIANRENMIMQVHTGIQEGNGNFLSNSRPELLSNLFLQYPDVTFDLFHISYPFQNEAIVLAKNFPNVFLDMCWSHIVSPNASIAFILEFIDTVPLNKLSAFGGDYIFVDGVLGHLMLAKQNTAKALSIKVEEGLFDIDRAKEIAEMFFYRNPLKIFRLESK